MPLKHEKLLKKAKESPKGWRLRELITMYQGYGFELRELSRHTSVSHPDIPGIEGRTTIPRHPGRELDPNYVREAVKFIEKLLRTKKLE